MTAAPQLPEPTGWRARAACARPRVDPEVFFPGPGERGKVARARRICARCPVQAPCLAEGLAMPGLLDEGIRAGTTAKDRAHIRGQRRRGGAR
jgi:WhiB family transcriptional regulator, redox-sensing transcriptional regulator